MLRVLVFACALSLSLSQRLPLAKWSPDSILHFSYFTSLHIADHTGDPTSSSQVLLHADIDISRAATLPNGVLLLRVELGNARAEEGGADRSLPPPVAPAYAVVSEGAVLRLHVAQKESPLLVNTIKGLASLLHSRTAPGEHREVDASGECRVAYRQTEDGGVEKTKRRCSPLDISAEAHGRAQGRTASRSRASKSVLRMRTTDGLLERAAGRDTVIVNFPLTGQLDDAALVVEAEQQLRLTKVGIQTAAKEEEEEEAAIKKLEGEIAFRAVTLAAAGEKKPALSERGLRTAVAAHRQSLSGDEAASAGAVEGFRALVSAVRAVGDAGVLERVLDDEELADVTPALWDAVAACGTGPCLANILRRLRDSDKKEEQERLLLGLSHVSEPDEKTLTMLLELARTDGSPDNVRMQLWATLGALVGRHRLSPAGKYARVTSESITFLQSLLSLSQEDSLLSAMVALQNVGECPDAAPRLLEFLKSSNASHRLHCAAMDTLMVSGVPDKLRGQARSRALRLVQSRPFQVDVTARVRALDFLLSLHPTLSQLTAAANAFRPEPLLREAFVKRVRAWSEKEGRSDAWEAVQERVPDLLRYPPPKVQPPLLQRSSFLATNASHGEAQVDLITGADGSLRRSESRADLILPGGGRLPLYRLTLFADGLNAMTGSESDAGLDVTAGVGLNLLGVGMRPVRLFDGYSGLMGAVWNAPTSLTPFLQVNAAVVDVSHEIHLQNGLAVRFHASGLASVDISGLVSIGLWTQRAELQLRTSAAVGVAVSAELLAKGLTATVNKNATAEVAFHFDANVDFSASPPKACLLAAFPDAGIVWTARRRFGKSRAAVLGQRLLPGVSLSLGEANDRACNELQEK